MYDIRFKQLAEIVMETKRLKQIPELLQLDGHPWVKVLRDGDRSAKSFAWASLLVKIVYRTDYLDAFESFDQCRGHHQAQTRRRKAKAEKAIHKERQFQPGLRDVKTCN
jgi:hypothetical protein